MLWARSSLAVSTGVSPPHAGSPSAGSGRAIRTKGRSNHGARRTLQIKYSTEQEWEWYGGCRTLDFVAEELLGWLLRATQGTVVQTRPRRSSAGPRGSRRKPRCPPGEALLSEFGFLPLNPSRCVSPRAQLLPGARSKPSPARARSSRRASPLPTRGKRVGKEKSSWVKSGRGKSAPCSPVALLREHPSPPHVAAGSR